MHKYRLLSKTLAVVMASSTLTADLIQSISPNGFVNLDTDPDKTISESDAIVLGSFVLDHALPETKGTLLFWGSRFEGITFNVPFIVDNSFKGDVHSIINVRLFYPASSEAAMNFLLPLKHKVLLFLKKEPQANTFSLINPWASWLPITDTQVQNSPLREMIVKQIEGFLKFHLAHSEQVLHYPDSPNSEDSEGLIYQPDPNLVRALRVGATLADGDHAFLALARQYMGEPGLVGVTAREIVAGSGDLQYASKRLEDYNGGKLPALDQLNFPAELGKAVTTCKDVSKMTPLILKALASPDPRLRSYVADALRQNKCKNKTLFPMLVQLLDNPDPEVQGAAMGCIFDMSGEIHKLYGTREIELPAYNIFLQNRRLYINQYKAWWEKHKDTLQ